MHVWRETDGCYDGRPVFRCERCGETCTPDPGSDVPDPDMVFWAGHASETLTCDDMVADSVLGS